jgi:hypothetical protein
VGEGTIATDLFAGPALLAASIEATADCPDERGRSA